MTNPTTSELYDVAAPTWVRTEPVLLSDYTARPFVLDAAAPLEGRRILDLGGGAGYVSRQLAAHAPARLRRLALRRPAARRTTWRQRRDPALDR